MKRLLPLAPLALLLLITMGVGPCDSKPLGSVDGCTYNGKSYAAGVTFRASDGCNTCSCDNGSALCTLLACVDASTDGSATCHDSSGKVISCATDGGFTDGAVGDGGRGDGGVGEGGATCFDANGNLIPCGTDAGTSCSYAGKIYGIGASFPCTDGCNTCICTSTGVASTKKACLDASADVPPTCYYVDGTPRACGFDAGVDCLYENTFYPVNSSFPSSDGCNKCTCTPGLMVACTQVACTDGGAQCNYAGKPYPVGASFPTVDGCNTCTCTAGGMIACTEKACYDGGMPTDGATDAPTTCVDATGKVTPCSSDGGIVGACKYGADSTCNDDIRLNTILGTCRADLTCDCGSKPINPMTGRCMIPGSTTGCSYGGITYPVGSKFMCTIDAGCNNGVCICAPPGQTTALCPGQSPPVCGFDAIYTYGDTGGLVAYTDRVTLTPPASYVLTRSVSGATLGSCGPALPACNTGPIDVSHLMADIADPTVQLLLSLSMMQPTLVGVDQRPFDGTVFSFKKNGTAGFLVGAPCNGASNCTDIPAGVSNLMADLQKLDAQQRQDPSCVAFLSMM